MRVLIVDDHDVVRKGIHSLFSNQVGFEVCGEAVDGQDACEKARELKPDLIIMDVSMPRLNGLEATRQVRSILPDCKVLIVSQHDTKEMARQALKAGARGYVVKSSLSKDLISAVVKISRHEYFFDPAILDKAPSAQMDVQEIVNRSAAFEKALHESEEHLQLVTRSMAASVTRCSRDLRYLWVNEGYADWLHKRPEEIIGRRIEDVIGQDGFSKLLPYFEKVLSRERVHYEEQVKFQSIGQRWISASYRPTLDPAGNADGWVAVIWDITERKPTEDALRESQYQLVLALESSRTALFDWDLIEQRGKWNPQMSAIYEFTPSGQYITAEEWQGLFHPNDVLRLTEEAERIWHGKDDQFTFEFRTVRPSGEVRWMLSHGRIIRDENGQAIRMIGTHNDISDRRRAEEALCQRQEELNEAQRLAKIGSWHWTPANDTVIWSDELYRIAGRDPKLPAVSYQDHHKLYTPDSWDRLQTVVNEAIKNGTPYSIELEMIRDDGERRWIIANGEAQRDATGVVTALRGTVQDIADRRHAEKATGLLAAIVASSDDAIVSKNLDGMITSWNNSAERIFGYAAEEAIGKHITLIIPPDRLSEEADILARLRRGEKIDHFQTVRKRKDGTFIDVSLTISPVRNTSGQVIGASKVARDITSEKRTAETIRIADETLRLMKAQDEERRRIARELHDSAGQTLTVLGVNLAQLVKRAEVVSPELARAGKEIEETVRQLHREIRTTSYLLHPPLLDEAGLNSALSWYVQGVAERSGITIDVNISDDFGRLPADMELAIFRVVQESLTNIHRHAESKTAFVRVAREHARVCIEVRDEGKGISPERLAEIQSRASGVGIAGMRERLRHFHGELKIESNGAGTKVSVAIPIAKEPCRESSNGLTQQLNATGL